MRSKWDQIEMKLIKWDLDDWDERDEGRMEQQRLRVGGRPIWVTYEVVEPYPYQNMMIWRLYEKSTLSWVKGAGIHFRNPSANPPPSHLPPHPPLKHQNSPNLRQIQPIKCFIISLFLAHLLLLLIVGRVNWKLSWGFSWPSKHRKSST